MARVSIVIPAYNAEKTISYCIESVLSQSFEDLEIIIVDDGSTDDTRIVVSNYAQTDPRIICISQENMGRSIARNNGIAESSGEWITFLDADDFLDVDALNLMIEKAEYYDGIWSGYRAGGSSFSYPKEIVLETPQLINAVLDPARYSKEIDLDEANSRSALLRSVWGKLYKKSLLINGSVRFPEGLRFGEDALFNLKYLNASNQILLLPDLVYNYCIEQSSTVNVFDKNDAIFLKKFIHETDLLIDDIFSEKEIPRRLRENFIALELSAVWCKAAASKEPIIDVIDGFKVFFRNDRVQSILRCNPAIGRPRKIACCIRFFLLRVNCPFLALLVDRALSRIM